MQRLFDLGIRIGAGGKVAVGQLLLLDDRNVLHADRLQHASDKLVAAAVERCVDDLQVSALADAGIHLLLQHLFQIGIIYAVVHIFDHAGLDSLVKVRDLDVAEHIELLDLIINSGSRSVGHLAAVLAVCLVAVILGRVVAGSHHDTCLTLEIANQIGENRGGLQLGGDVHLQAVCRQHFGSLDHKQISLDAAVVRNGDGAFAVFVEHIIGETLRSLTHNINIHAVGTGADNTSQAGGAKFQRGIKAVEDSFVVIFDGGKLLH